MAPGASQQSPVEYMEYFRRHSSALEAAISDAVQATLNAMPNDPVAYCAAQLVQGRTHKLHGETDEPAAANQERHEEPPELLTSNDSSEREGLGVQAEARRRSQQSRRRLSITLGERHAKRRSAQNHEYKNRRQEVPDELVPWGTAFPEYEPREWTHESVLNRSSDSKSRDCWADPAEIERVDFDNRITYAGDGEPKELRSAVEFDVTGAPQNPAGRTGLRGRGLLGRWGPNHTAEPIITRYKPGSGQIQLLVVQGQDSGHWAVPGGTVSEREVVPASLQIKLDEIRERLKSAEEQRTFETQVEQLFQLSGSSTSQPRTLIFRGYMDDPRNTDNAWVETTACHFHCSDELASYLSLEEGAAHSLAWLDVDMQSAAYRNMQSAHRSLVERAISRMEGQIDPSCSWDVAGWLRSLPLAETVAKKVLHAPAWADQFEFLQKLSTDDLLLRLKEARMDGLFDVISKALDSLREQGASSGSALSRKFVSEGGTFQMAFGSLSLFYSGLEGLVGGPLMVEGSIQKAMEKEHCSLPDSTLPFNTSNMMEGVMSCSEWEFVVNPQMDGHYRERTAFSEEHPEWCRKPKLLEKLKEEMSEVNGQLQERGHTQMVIEELVGGRLYTGPMYEKYNAVLRFHSAPSRLQAAAKVPFLQKKCEDMGLGAWEARGTEMEWSWINNYATTIHSINSCVLKLSKLTIACKVWRGFTGATLPASFFEANDEGVRGGIEYGFSSTTTDRSQALHYADGMASTVFEMEMGMVDRGADLSWLSQYPHEKEILFSPLMGQQALGTRVVGNTLVVESRLNLNMQSLTLEEVTSKRRKVVKDMITNVISDFGSGINSPITAQAKLFLQKVLEPLQNEKPEHYNDDANLGAAINETVFCSKAIQGWDAGLRSLSRHGEALSLETLTLRACSDVTLGGIGALLQLGKLQVLRIERAGFNATAAKRLSLELRTAPSLTELSLLHNDLVNGGTDFAGLQALCQSLKCNKTLTNLNIAKNDISSRGAKLIADTLAGGGFLAAIDLAANDIDAEGVKFLADALYITSLSHLNLSDNSIGDDGAMILGPAIGASASLTSLDLSGCEIQAEGAKHIAEGLKSSSSLRHLNLTRNVLTVYGQDFTGIERMADAIRASGTLKSIDLRASALCGVARGVGTHSEEGVKKIAEAISLNVSLSSVDVGQNSIGKAMAVELISIFKGKQMAYVGLAACDLGADGVKSAADYMSTSGTLKVIDLSDNQLGVEGARTLIEGGAFRDTLTECTLIGNDFSVECAQDLARISRDKKLSLSGIGADQAEMSFSGRRLQPADAVLIAAAMEFRSSLTECTLLGTGLTVDSAKEFAKVSIEKEISLCGIYVEQTERSFQGEFLQPYEAVLISAAMRCRKSLTSINLYCNSINADVAEFIAECIKTSPIQSINLGHNKLGAAGAKALVDGGAFHGSLTWLSLRYNQIGDDGAKAIAEGIRVSRSLDTIDLSLNEIGADGAEAVAEGICAKGSLKVVDLTGNGLHGSKGTLQKVCGTRVKELKL